MRKRIAEFNKNMPSMYQIGISQKDLHIFLVTTKTDKKGKPVKSRISVKMLKSGTTKEIKLYLDGMLGALDIAKSFQEFADKVDRETNNLIPKEKVAVC